ncbi:MAG: beta-N-acetylhexosaminidase [Spirochaetae bacterium HGW-Spirochaetae-3]|jgi:hexosaminidase|nr:MAG: beta-N-acetylhexosaminidase [Spirochaetae bacterium HGW-Spirochaetae-3]
MTLSRHTEVPDAGLVPRPCGFSYLPGAFKPRTGATISTDPSFASEGAWAATALETAFTVKFAPEAPGKGTVRVTRVAGLGAEGYRLEIKPTGVRAEASEPAGAFYALQTLRALALIYGDRAPACRIEDEPRFPWRGYMLDTVRNYFEPAFIKRLIDLAALHKLNRFHWHLTDDQGWRMPVRSHPELADTAAKKVDRRYLPHVERTLVYSEAAIADVLAYAAVRHVLVIPEIEMPGHVTALLSAHPEFSCTGGTFEPEDRFGVFSDVLCAGSDETFEFIGDVLSETARLFPGPFVHFGGDEVPIERWASCPRCGARVEAEGLSDAAALRGWFTRKAVAMLAERGKRAVGWDEVVEGAVPADVVVMAWRSAERGVEAARAGHDVVMCPGTKACYLDHKHLDSPDEPGHLGVSTVRDSYAFEPLAGFDAESAKKVLGVQGNLWTEIMYFGRQVEYMAFPRLSALAETGWTPRDGKNFEGFSTRLRHWGLALDRYDVARYRGPLE